MQNASGQVVAVILARGGSKGIPKKNLIDFCGHPLLAWSVMQARQAEGVHSVYVSSDSEEILAAAARYGAQPIVRPAELSTDTATSEVALAHALDEIETTFGVPVDLVVFLQATSPLRSPDDISRAVACLRGSRADSLFSAALLDDFCLWTRTDGQLKGFGFDPWNRGRRQDREPLLLENGSIYVFKPEVLRQGGNRLGGRMATYEMPYWKSYEIDEMSQVELCEYYFNKHALAASVGLGPRSTAIPADIAVLVYDFDGVMTDNRALVQEDGTESVTVNRADGLGVDMLRRQGFTQLILSTEENRVVKARADKLRIEAIYGCACKRTAMEDYCRRHGIDIKTVLFIGNDLNDKEVMQAVGFCVAPADAHPEICALAHLVTRAKGGSGVIRELAGLLQGAR